jgi:hypothetical protein
MSFQITALAPEPFDELFGLSDEALAERRAARVTATSNPGFPCRVSLADAEVGEELLLVNFQHQSANSPFQSNYAIYVRKDATRAQPGVGEVPEQLHSRILSLRAFDVKDMLIDADLAEGDAIAPALKRLLDESETAYVHIHYAKPGCYAARADRA